MTGRFVNADDALRTNLSVGANLFAYCGDDPVNYVDPSGRWFGIDDVFTGPFDELLVFAIVALAAGATAGETTDQPWTDGTGALKIEPVLPAIERPATILPPPKIDQEPEKSREPLPWPADDSSHRRSNGKFYDAMLLYPGVMVNYAYVMDMEQASMHLLEGNHVWTEFEVDAVALANYTSGGAVSGNDELGVRRGQNAFHYHLKDRMGGVHIFYGTQAVEIIWPF